MCGTEKEGSDLYGTHTCTGCSDYPPDADTYV